MPLSIVVKVLTILSFSAMKMECLKPAYIDFMMETIKDAGNCEVVLYKIKTSDVGAIQSMSNKPLTVITKPGLEIRESLSVLRAGCVVLFTAEELDNSTDWLLRKTRHKTVFVLEAGIDCDIQGGLLDGVTFVRESSSGNLVLAEHVSNVSGGIDKIIWRKHAGERFKNGAGFLPGKGKPLRGKLVTISLVLSVPYVMLGRDKTYTGAEVEIIKMISKEMEFDLKVKEEKFWVSKDPKTRRWTGVIGSVVDGHSQIGLDINYDNGYGSAGYPAVMSRVIYYKDQNYLVPKPKLLKPYYNFLRPFTVIVWLGFLASLVICTVVTSIVAKCNGKEDLNWLTIFFYLFGSMWQQNLRHTLGCPTSTVYYILFGSWFIVVCLKGLAYNCDLRAFIINKVYEAPIETDEDIVRLNVDNYFAIGTGALELFQNSASPAKREIAARAIRHNTLYKYRDDVGPSEERMVMEGGVRMSIRSRNQFIMSYFERHFGYQPLRATKYTTYTVPVGMAMPQYEPWTDDFNRILLHVLEGGMMDFLMSKYMPFDRCAQGNNDEDNKRVKEDKNEAFRVEHIVGPLTVLATGLAFSVIVACFEKAIYHNVSTKG